MNDGTREVDAATRPAEAAEPEPGTHRDGAAASEAAALGHLSPLAGALRRRRRHVSYRQAEAAAVRLAARLRDALPPEELAAARFRAVPRGGLIVLGMLAYPLGLTRRQLRGAGDGDEADGDGGAAPLVLVDDCALSGLRLAQELATVAVDRRVVVAHLFSPPPLRRAVLERDRRVVACVAAHDLADLGETLWPDEAARRAWLRRWRQRLAEAGDGAAAESGERFWLGVAQPVSFDWSEPDRLYWNEVTGRVEKAWRFEPPHGCLKHRTSLASGLPAAAWEVADGGRQWNLGEGVVWSLVDGDVWLLRESDEEVFSLSASAALAWRALAAGAGEEGAAAALADHLGADVAAARLDVASLVADLASAGLLAPARG